MLTELKHWWQRNFGYVILIDAKGIPCAVVRCRRGIIGIAYDIDFYCHYRMGADGSLILNDIDCDGYGEPCPLFTWSYEIPKRIPLVSKGGAPC